MQVHGLCECDLQYTIIKLNSFFFTLLFRGDCWVQKKTTTKIIIISSNSGLFFFFISSFYFSSSSSSSVRLLLHVRVWICAACVYRDTLTWNKHKNVWTIYTCFFFMPLHICARHACVCMSVCARMYTCPLCMYEKNIFILFFLWKWLHLLPMKWEERKRQRKKNFFILLNSFPNRTIKWNKIKEERK